MSNPPLELCIQCDQPTGRAGACEDSMYCCICDEGPFCEECDEEHEVVHGVGGGSLEIES